MISMGERVMRSVAVRRSKTVVSTALREAVVRTAMMRTSPLGKPVLAVAMMARSRVMPAARTVMRMVPVPITSMLVMGMLAALAILLGVGRLFELLADGCPFGIAQLAIAVAVETGQQDVAQGIAP
ncbi:MAG: hypothetical protein KF708_12520 [Pirellulales bacterium]|nr:hypothetical protein [Pirellulales bacterium]